MPRVRISFAGSGKEFERRQVAAAGFDYVPIACAPLTGRLRDLPGFLLANLSGYRRGETIPGRRTGDRGGRAGRLCQRAHGPGGGAARHSAVAVGAERRSRPSDPLAGPVSDDGLHGLWPVRRLPARPLSGASDGQPDPRWISGRRSRTQRLPRAGTFGVRRLVAAFRLCGRSHASHKAATSRRTPKRGLPAKRDGTTISPRRQRGGPVAQRECAPSLGPHPADAGRLDHRSPVGCGRCLPHARSLRGERPAGFRDGVSDRHARDARPYPVGDLPRRWDDAGRVGRVGSAGRAGPLSSCGRRSSAAKRRELRRFRRLPGDRRARRAAPACGSSGRGSRPPGRRFMPAGRDVLGHPTAGQARRRRRDCRRDPGSSGEWRVARLQSGSNAASPAARIVRKLVTLVALDPPYFSFATKVQETAHGLRTRTSNHSSLATSPRHAVQLLPSADKELPVASHG